jgi:hypothetical protein
MTYNLRRQENGSRDELESPLAAIEALQTMLRVWLSPGEEPAS